MTALPSQSKTERGVIQALIDKGIQEGDTVSIYDLEFDYVP